MVRVDFHASTGPGGTESRQDRIRLKNLLRGAERQLAERRGCDRTQRRFPSPARLCWRRATSWQHQSDGLAVFVTGGEFHRYRVPLRFQERVTVAKRFQLAALPPAEIKTCWTGRRPTRASARRAAYAMNSAELPAAAPAAAICRF